MEKLEIIIDEVLANDGPTPVALGSVDVHDAGMMQSDPDMGNDTSYDDMCATGWKGCTVGKGAGKKGPDGPGASRRGRELMKTAARAAGLIGAVTKTREALGMKAKARARAKPIVL